MLENVVRSHNELRMIKTQADPLKALNGSVLTYTQYITLLQSSANTYGVSLLGNAKNHTRSVYMSELSHNTERTDLYNNDDTPYDIDSSIDTIHANFHKKTDQTFRDQVFKVTTDNTTTFKTTP